MAWQHAPVHIINAAAWLALVVTMPFDDALTMTWGGALTPDRAPRLLPADGRT